MNSAISSDPSPIGLPAFRLPAAWWSRRGSTQIALPSVEDIRRDSDLFFDGVRSPEFQDQMQAAMKHGFQTRVAETNLVHLLGDLEEERRSKPS